MQKLTSAIFFSTFQDPPSLMLKQVIWHTCAITQNTIPIPQSSTLKHTSLLSKESYLIWFSELVSLINTITNLFDIPDDKNKKNLN